MLQKIEPVILSSAASVAKYFKTVFEMVGEEDKHKERMYVAGLNNKNTLLYIDLVSIGTVNQTTIYTREIFRQAIMKNASNIIICHNHQSGNQSPSRDDIVVTKKVIEVGKIINVVMLDHIILSGVNDEYLSFSEEGLLEI